MKDWAAPSPMDGAMAKGDQAVAGAQEVEGIGGVTGGRPPHWWATQGSCKEAGAIAQSYPAEEKGNV